jgi:hypothetical protein
MSTLGSELGKAKTLLDNADAQPACGRFVYALVQRAGGCRGPAITSKSSAYSAAVLAFRVCASLLKQSQLVKIRARRLKLL